MKVSTELIKALREQTSAGIMECKQALQETSCDLTAAATILGERGYALADKKKERVASQGLVECYIHGGGRIGSLVELRCESDFVARTPEFKELAHNLAMQIVAANPKYISQQDVPEGNEFCDEECLLLQPFIKDPARTVQDIVTESIAKVRENVQIGRFARFELGLDGQDA